MTTTQRLERPAPANLDQRTRESIEVYGRISRVGEEATRRVLDAPVPALVVQNLPFVTMAGLFLEGSMRPSGIARATGLSSGGVSALLERLENAGLLSRGPGQVPGDRRGVVVRLTDDGEATMDIVASLVSEFVERLFRDLRPLIELRARRGAIRPAAPLLPPLRVPDQGSAGGVPVGPRREDVFVFLCLVQLGERVGRARWARMDDLRSLPGNVPLLAIIALFIHDALRPSEIATMTGLTSGGVSDLLERMEAGGFITRSHGHVADDRRAVTVRLTAKGRAAMLVEIDLLNDAVDRFLDEIAATIDHRARGVEGRAGAATG